MIAVGELAQMGSMCAWEGCTVTFERDMPPDWNWLLAFWAPGSVLNIAEIGPGQWLCDCCLCGKHSRMLDSKFKRLKPAPEN